MPLGGSIVVSLLMNAQVLEHHYEDWIRCGRQNDESSLYHILHLINEAFMKRKNRFFSLTCDHFDYGSYLFESFLQRCNPLNVQLTCSMSPAARASHLTISHHRSVLVTITYTAVAMLLQRQTQCTIVTRTHNARRYAFTKASCERRESFGTYLHTRKRVQEGHPNIEAASLLPSQRPMLDVTLDLLRHWPWGCYEPVTSDCANLQVPNTEFSWVCCTTAVELWTPLLWWR